jgi:hypothetical protein
LLQSLTVTSFPGPSGSAAFAEPAQKMTAKQQKAPNGKMIVFMLVLDIDCAAESLRRDSLA